MTEMTHTLQLPALAPECQLTHLDGLCAAWLHEKTGRTGSARTRHTYATLLADFRRFLADRATDLDAGPRLIALAAQAWAAAPGPTGRDPGPAYHNQRLAALSSLYEYALRHDFLPGPNPIDKVPRRPIQDNRSAVLPDVEVIIGRLAAIDRATLEGRRDHVILAVTLSTGRRLAEVASLRARDLHLVDADAPTGARLFLSFRRLKGGKQATDKLTPALTRELIVYLNATFGPSCWSRPLDAPVWVVLSRNEHRGRALRPRGLADLCQRRLGVNFHALRHVFASVMEDEGGKVSEIAAQLGHASVATTSRYLTALRQADNPDLMAMAIRLGLE